jgi:hypothetical protein
MSQQKLELKTLDSCKPGDLIRIKLGEPVEWAFVGKKVSPGMFPILVLTGKAEPYFLNVVNDMDALKQAYELPVIFYGRAYAVEPDHIGPCQIDTGPLFGNGSIIIAQAERVIRADFENQKARAMFYRIDSGEVRGEPGGARAAFAKWKLWLLPSITGEERPIVVASFAGQAKPKEKAA